MSALLNLLLSSGQLLGRAALRTLQEAASAGVRARDHISAEADRLGSVIEEHDNMLGLIQARSAELSHLLGAETDIGVAVVDGAARDSLETYLRTMRVPYVQLDGGGAGAAATTAGGLRHDDQIFLTVSPKGSYREKSTRAHMSTKKYSTRPYDKDLEFLKQQIREKFKKLLQANVDKANAIDNKVRDIDISKTLRQMTDTQKFILKDLDNLMRCLREIDELRTYLKFVGIKNNTIRVVVMGDDQNNNRFGTNEPPTPKLQALERAKEKLEDNTREDNRNKDKLDDENKGIDVSKALTGLGDSYANYLSKVTVERSEIITYNKENLEPIYVHAKRKREDEPLDEAVDGKGRIANVIAEKYLNKRRKRFCEAMLNVGFGGSAYLVHCDSICDTTSKACKPDEATGKISDGSSTEKTSTNSQAIGPKVPKSIDNPLKKFDAIKIDENQETAQLPQITNEDLIKNENGRLSMHSSTPGSKLNVTKEKARKWEKRIKKFTKVKEIEKAQKLKSPGQDRFNKAEKNLQKMKRLEEQVSHDCKLMFANKRQFLRFERQLEYQTWKEKERETENDLLCINQTIFNDVDSQLARDMAIGQLEKEVEFASRLISENQNAFNMFQRRMLHRLVNDIEPSQADLPNMSLLTGQDITINDKPAFDMIVEKLQTYDLVNIKDSPSKPVVTNENKHSDFILQPETSNMLEQTLDIPTEDVEFLAEFDGVRISIVKMPGDELVIEGDIEEAQDTIEDSDIIEENEPVLKIESDPKNERKVRNSLKLTEIRQQQKMTEELLELNEKVFNDCEKMMKTVQIIEPKTKFSTNKKEEDSRKLLNQSKFKIGDDKRKISTVKSMYKNDNGIIFKKSKSETSLLADIKKQNLSLYEQIFQLNDQKNSNLNFDDIFGDVQAAKTQKVIATKTGCEHTQKEEKGAIKQSKIKNDVDIEKAIEDINQMLTQKGGNGNTKATKAVLKERDRKTVYKKTKNKQTRQNMEKKGEPRSLSKIPKIFCRNGDKHLILDTEKVQEEIVLKQKARSVLSKQKTVQSSVRKQNLRKVTANESKPDQKKTTGNIKRPSTAERNRQNAKTEALKRNKFINKNAASVAIDKDLEKKTVRKDIAANKESRIDNTNNTTSSTTQKQIKYKTPEKSRYTKIYEQIKARQAEKLQQLKAKKKAGHDGITSRSKVSGGSNSLNKEEPVKQTKKPISAKPPIVACKKATGGDAVSVVKGPVTATKKQHLDAAITKTKSRVTITKNKSIEGQASSKEPDMLNLSVETLFTSKGVETIDFVKDASSSELEELEYHKSTLLTSRNCADGAVATKCGGEGRRPGSRVAGVASLGDLVKIEGRCDDLQRKQTTVLVTANVNNAGSRTSVSAADAGVGGEAESEVSGASTVWRDSFQSVTDLMEEVLRGQGPECTASLADLVDRAGEADAAGAGEGDILPDLCLQLMDEADIVSLVSTVSSACSLDSEAKQKAAAVANLREIKSEILREKFNRKPWGTSVVNEVPTQLKRAPGPATLPQTSIWSHGTRARAPAPPKPKPKPGDKKYRYESKEVVMGNKVTKVTYLVEE